MQDVIRDCLVFVTDWQRFAVILWVTVIAPFCRTSSTLTFVHDEPRTSSDIRATTRLVLITGATEECVCLKREGTWNEGMRFMPG